MPQNSDFLNLQYRVNDGTWVWITGNPTSYLVALTSSVYAELDYSQQWPPATGLTFGDKVDIGVITESPNLFSGVFKNLKFGFGQNSGDFTSLCGTVTPFSITWSGQDIYLNMSATAGKYGTCSVP